MQSKISLSLDFVNDTNASYVLYTGEQNVTSANFIHNLLHCHHVHHHRCLSNIRD